MEFKHPIFDSPEEYEEYNKMMNELADQVEFETGDPQPEDLTDTCELYEKALEISRSIPKSVLIHWAKQFGNGTLDDEYSSDMSNLLNLLARDNSHYRRSQEAANTKK